MLADSLKASGLRCSEWAEKHRVLKAGGLYSFHDYPYLRAIHDDWSPELVIPKGAQVGVTCMAMNKSFYCMDVRREDVLYVFPTEWDASDFSAARFDVALELSPYLDELFTDVRNVGLKRAGTVNFYCRTAGSRSQMKSIPATGLVLDEFDEMNPAKVALARKRTGGTRNPWEMNISTPTLPDYGIWLDWKEAEQWLWLVRCYHCNRLQLLRWPDSLEWRDTTSPRQAAKTAHFRCLKCGKPWNYGERMESMRAGEWHMEQEGVSGKRGYHISQLYSPTRTAYVLVKEFLEAADDEVKLQEFYNSDLGLPYLAEGSRLAGENVDACVDPGRKIRPNSHGATMGIDVAGAGRPNYVEISEWVNGRKILLNVLRADWGELRTLMAQYSIWSCVIDAQPEVTESLSFANEFEGRVLVAYYPENLKQLINANQETSSVNLHRTGLMDLTLKRYRTGAVSIPRDMALYETYKAHLCAPTKIYKEDKRGRQIARYINANADHFAHAALYNEAAYNLSPTVMTAVVRDTWHEPDPGHGGEFVIY